MRRARARLAARAPLAALMISLSAGPELAPAHPAKGGARLSKIGPAPEFALTAADGARLALADLRGTVVAVTFIYAGCADTCPLLTAKLVPVRKRLGAERAGRTRFVAVTVDPDRDTSEALRRYDGAVHVSVSDTGVGIAAEDQDKIFEAFRQVGAAGARREGTGLGLTLTQQFVGLHGGRVWVESQVGKGSTFTFTLPVRTPEAAGD